MDVSSSTNLADASINAMKKSMDTQEQQVLKVLESSQEQMQEMNAQTAKKTGLGTTLDLKS